ncbi:hypothetical protein ASV53_11225 [Photobacterium sanguinicancri]|uniref:Uncharacterized protein n=1 Tax=Photobacterium sanguinicancri TaxID=875932 RepID=A0ABX4FY85_9GAMM|nr:hypothetical protein ASV53_11225 [Photobacterium sanguinicancri]
MSHLAIRLHCLIESCQYKWTCVVSKEVFDLGWFEAKISHRMFWYSAKLLVNEIQVRLLNIGMIAGI